MIFDHLIKYSNKIALISDERSVTYQTLELEADNLVRLVKPRQLCVIMATNSIKCIEAYVGCLRKRIPILLVNNQIPNTNLAKILKDFKPNYIFSDINLEFGESYEKTDDMIWQNISQKSVLTTNEDLALLLTTSGSTGSPKFVKLSYGNIDSNTYSIIEYLRISSEDVGITCLPMYYSYGLSIINTHIAAGASLVVTNESLIAPAFWKLFVENKVTALSGVPYSFSLLRRFGFDRRVFPSLRYVTQAGGKLSPEDVLFWQKSLMDKRVDFFVMYGQTEATARMSYLPPVLSLNHPDSIGIPIPGGEFKIINEQGMLQQINQVGELIYKGRNVSLGYATCFEELEKPDVNKGILHTGDMAYQDGNGLFYIVGRKSRFVKLFGNRTNLDEIESLLKRNEITAVCGGCDDKLIVFLPKESHDKISEVKEIIAHNTLISPIAYSISLIEEIPRSDSGKILYSKLPTR